MKTIPSHRGSLAGLLVLGLLGASCAGGSGPGWTYAPLGPTPSGAASPAPSPTGPTGSATLVLKIATNTDKPLGYEPNELTAPASTVVEVDYSNNTALPHNIHFFAGPDENSPSIAKTDIQTGPGASASVTFTTPSQPGDYFFWCDVHQSAMTGTLHVTQ